MNQDWQIFKQSAQRNLKVPEYLRFSIQTAVLSDLSPSFLRVLAKLGVIHVLTSLVTLSICPQFGFRLWGEGMGLMNVFMRLGEVGCALACGIFFLGASLLLASVILKRAEWRTIRNHRLLTVTALLLPSLGFFRIMDGVFFLEFSLGWLIGAGFAGIFLLEGVWRWKYLRPLRSRLNLVS